MQEIDVTVEELQAELPVLYSISPYRALPLEGLCIDLNSRTVSTKVSAKYSKILTS